MAKATNKKLRQKQNIKKNNIMRSKIMRRKYTKDIDNLDFGPYLDTSLGSLIKRQHIFAMEHWIKNGSVGEPPKELTEFEMLSDCDLLDDMFNIYEWLG